MIFKDILEQKFKEYGNEMERVLDVAWNKQNHKGDLLLLFVNGFYNYDTLEWNKHRTDKFNPYSIGPGLEGHSEQVHYQFIHKYRTTHIFGIPYSQYLDKLKWSPERKNEIDTLVDNEETSIQLEMLIYLKFWEADMIIKRFYQLARILEGKPYDWHFKIANSNRDTDATGSRQDIIRSQIRNKIQAVSPKFYDLIKESYKTQIRNSIAHSNYSFLNRTIGLNNYIKEDKASQLKGISFDEWISIFHNTIVLHNEYVKMGNIINYHYGEIAKQNNMICPIMITEKNGKTYELALEYREQYKDWHFKTITPPLVQV